MPALGLLVRHDIGCEAGSVNDARSLVDNLDRIEVGGKFQG